MFLFLASALFIFGPSCGGKSTLSKSLIQRLGPSWVYLDRDQLIEEELCTDDNADSILEENILLAQSKNQDVIVDAQIPWRAPKNENELFILVYAPLEKLLERDAQRTLRLNRPAKRAHYARLYVEKTFFEVFEAPDRHCFRYDAIFDSSNRPIASEIEEVLQLLLTPIHPN